MKKIRVAVIDDHSVVRLGLKFAVRMFKDMEFAGEHPRGEGAAEFVDAAKPDVTLLDIRMPGKDGIEALRDILAAHPDAKVVMLTTSGTDEDIYRSLELGAKGYVMKDGDSGEIMKAIRAVADGGRFIPEDVRVIYDRRAAAPISEPPGNSRFAGLLLDSKVIQRVEIAESPVKRTFRGVRPPPVPTSCQRTAR